MLMRQKSLGITVRLAADVLYYYGYSLLIPCAIAVGARERQQALIFGLGAAVVIGICWTVRQRTSATGVQKRHAATALALTWTLLALFSFIPFVAHGMVAIDALFESFSAWTDTGLTMIPDPASLPLSLGVFRIQMQWISGLGIVIIMLFLYGPASRAAQSLFQAEGRFEDFAMSVWQVGRTVVSIYVGYTFAGFVLFWILGVPPFDALMHAITSLSTGGFSTNSVGVGVYGALPSIVAMILMLCGGISFGSHQALLSGRVRKFLRNPEVQMLFVVAIVSWGLLMFEHLTVEGRLGEGVLTSAFYAVSAISTCGAGTSLPLSRAPDVVIFTITMLMISGAAYGSTTGALKLWRLIIAAQVVAREIKRPFYPESAVLPIRVGSNRISGEIVIQVMAYIILYLALGLAGSLVFMLFGHSSLHALFTVFSAQGNVGLNAMPDAVYYGMHPVLKVQLILHMLIGRVEILPLLFLLRGLRD
jgi:trk system potassium uptake protein TrkH